MLTLAFAQIVWSVAFQWDDFTGGSNGVVGVWPPDWLDDKRAYFWFTLALVGAALAAIAWIAHAPLGYSLRACRDSPLRAAAIGIDVRKTQWLAFALAGGFAGLAGGLYAFSKGSISPETLAIPRSVDALVMVLLGGLNALVGPLLGAAAFTWLSDTLARATEYWRAVLGAAILLIVHRVSRRDRRRGAAVAGAGSPVSAGSPLERSDAVLRVDGLTKSFGGDDVVHDVSFAVAAGELVALIGPNGAGKTTCFNLVNGQLRPDRGTVTLAGTRIDGLPPRAIARLGVGRTFQVAATFASMTVRENVQLALLSHAGAPSRNRARAPPIACARKRTRCSSGCG